MMKRNEPIALVSSACRFAGGATSPSKLWDILKEPVDLRSQIPPKRFNVDAFYHSNGSYHGHSNVRHAYLLDEDLAAFDADFFRIKPVEARAIDPQQRFLLEVVYEALEAGGMVMSNLRDSNTGVYVGVMFSDYATMLLQDYQNIPTYYATGTGQSILSNRISHFFDWHGPSVTVDTACSSSLVAVHMAVQALRSGESRMAIACGTNLIIGPEGFIIESKLNMLSPDGRSRMWDQAANGYARGEGVAAVVLKTLSSALEDGDHIECIIRETGLNQDGATTGITMPSSKAQEALIRSTYAKAGLDLRVPSDRPQYFEAHGTGTPAGDPTEAEAVFKAFYTSDSGEALHEPLSLGTGHPLYVGSIKTVFGHTEGTAGVAALIKVSLALQHKLIPPNLLFEQLSDRVAPFYKNLEILQRAKAWPETVGQVRRASVNSFGFGGANAHAIVESYDRASSDVSTSIPLLTPVVFSAFSSKSLHSTLSQYEALLEGVSCCRETFTLQDLAWTLRQHRSTHQYRLSFAAASLDDLQTKILAKLEEEDCQSTGIKGIQSRNIEENPGRRILGIFTGQGAQYARMGAELIEQSPVARRIIQKLESYLSSIPDMKERPSWSLEAELLADAAASRIHEAELSQPLCTALQILLVDLLKLAGIQFSAVVGHSSGEIAAAYATGYLSAQHAILISYYRGLSTALSFSPNGVHISGAMMAVGTDMADMEDLLSDELFAGRITVAASNSSTSVTISGDEDAISEVSIVLDDEEKFHRQLKVDKAYHSAHMIPCFEAYKQSLRKIDIVAQIPGEKKGIWYSSLRDGMPVGETIAEELGSSYWPENMTKPVLFSQALSAALEADTYDLALEIGPHPALAGPARQIMRDFLDKEIPYYGLLSRGMTAVDTSSTALGCIWSHLGPQSVNLDNYERAVSGLGSGHRYALVKGLPTYAWNHSTRYWHESRTSRKIRSRPHQVHSLLGDLTSDSALHQMSWRNLLRVTELEWLSGHAVQGQTVFPASGYLVSAVEASRFVAEGTQKDIRLIEIKDFTIHQAVAFEQDDSGIEVLIEMNGIERTQRQTGDVIRARFTYSAALNALADDLALAASGDVLIHIGEASLSVLPARGPTTPHMLDIEPERFYTALADLGYNFSGRFRSLIALRRKRGKSTCSIKLPPFESEDVKDHSQPFLIHPAELDAVLQSAIVAYSYPYDEELRVLHLPTSIQKIRVNPAALVEANSGNRDSLLPIDAFIKLADASRNARNGIFADINFYAANSANLNAAIQIQGAAFKPLGGSVAEEYRSMYSQVQWILDRPDGMEASRGLWESESHQDTVRLLERIAIFYLRQFDSDVPLNHPARQESPTKWYLNFAKHVLDVVASGNHKWYQDSWHNDTEDSIQLASAPYRHLPDVQIMHLVGQQMPRVFAGETTMLEEFRVDSGSILDRYYAEGIGLTHLAAWVGRAVKQLTDRHPHMNVLEVGAGTGGATKAIFSEIGDKFRSYTYTDISAGFFETAADVFEGKKNKMRFKTFDVEKDPMSQGFVPGSYDLVIAFFVIHATADMEASLRNMRKLLRPGGYLIVGEGSETGGGAATSGFIFGTLPGWWVGTDRGRVLSPLISPQEWDHLLQKTGFSGADAAPPISVEDIFNVFPIVSQAVDDYVHFLREPLSMASSLQLAGVPPVKRLVLVGGETRQSSHLIDSIEALLGRRLAAEVYKFKTLLDVDFEIFNTDSSAVISLTELDSFVFENLTPERFHALRAIFEPGKTILWVTSGRLSSSPYANMTVAFGRVATHETPDLRLQQLDIPGIETKSAEQIAESFLRLHAAAERKEGDKTFWTLEPEIVVDDLGRQLVPRLGFLNQLNDRYNAGRRPVVKKVDINLCSASVALQTVKDGKYSLYERSRYEVELEQHSDSSGMIELRTVHSTISAIKTPFGHKFLILGQRAKTDIFYLALLDSVSSNVRVPTTCAVEYHFSEPLGAETLAVVAAHLVAMALLNHVYGGQTVVIHNAPSLIASALVVQATVSGTRIVFTTDSTEDVPAAWIKLPQYLSRTEIDDLLVLEEPPIAFIGLSDPNNTVSENEATMLLAFQWQCDTISTAASVFSSESSGVPASKPIVSAALGERIRKSLAFSQHHNTIGSPHPTSSTVGDELIDLDDLLASHHSLNLTSIISWASPTPVPVTVSRLDSGQMFKSRDTTYWIVGMSGALGISAADWMISRGARSLVMSSRRPDIAPEWITAHKRKGATVTIIPCDVTDEESVQRAYKLISESLPTVRGVIHGAMLLHDVSIRNMSFDQMRDVIRPKVDGAMYLDRLFWEFDLDFFVLTSSINTVIGNLGQANYAAANAFMCSLAAQRRKRGFRASAVNGGAIIGAGYMEREARRAWDKIAQHNYMMRLSEEDFVQSICEAIEASRLDAVEGPEICTGLNNVPFEARNQPFWSSDPKFSIFVQHSHDVADSEDKHKVTFSGGSGFLQDLQRCETDQQVYDVIKYAFAATLRAILQVSTSDEDLMASRSSDIGLDSLVSVNVRSWFLKHLQVGIPVLKIMGNDTMENLVRLAVETMPAELVPGLHGSVDVEGDDNTDQQSLPSLTGDSSSKRSRGTSTPMTEEDSRHSFEVTTKHHTNASTQIDWEAESTPPADLFHIPRAVGLARPSLPPNVVVLTGAGGLYGRHLLNYLLDHTSTKKIICIALRNLSGRLENAELPAPSDRVEYYEGNLIMPLLGLTSDQAAAIFSDADAVIHNGADTSHMKGYLDLRASNVGSTLTLMRLCLPRRIPLHYVSSVGLAILYGEDAFPPVSVAGRALPATDGSFGYASTKWTCERLLEQTHDMYGGEWPVCIHRPSTIIRKGEDAVGLKAQLDWVNALFEAARKSKTVPQVQHNSGALDLVYPRSACRDLVGRVLQPDARMQKGEVGYVHQVGDVVLPLGSLQDIGLGEQERKPFDVVPMEEWIERAVAEGMHPAVAALVEIMDEPNGYKYPRLLKE